MIKDSNDIRNQIAATSLFLKDKNSSPVSYTKTDKLISALYMVTDIMDKDEPLRNKLRSLGVDVISDLHSNFIMEVHFLHKVNDKIDEIMSFLGISETLNLISDMNSNILIKEFLALKQSIKDLNPGGELSLFFKDEDIIAAPAIKNSKRSLIGHDQPTRIGVQKGGTLMKALSDRISSSDRNQIEKKTYSGASNLDVSKTERRDEIIKIIKDSAGSGIDGGGLTITDIKSKAQGPLVACSEKTLQRELASMVLNGALNKTGSKRWSRYLIKA